LNGLRVSEACAADVVDLGVERAHRVLSVVGKGGQRRLVPLAPQTSAQSMRRSAAAPMARC
jgi:site-specific recombinase XerD